MPPDPPRCLRLQHSRGALRRQENIHVQCFRKYVRYFTKQLKTLRYENCFLSPVATDGIDGNGLKLEKIGQFFRDLMLCVPKISDKALCFSQSERTLYGNFTILIIVI